MLEGSTWGYTLSDVSRTNVRTLVDDAVIEDTDGIQRSTGRISRSVERFASPPTSNPWIPAGLRGLAVLCLCIGLIGLGLGLIEQSAPGRIATWFVHRDGAGPRRSRWASWFYQPEDPTIRGADPGRPRLWGVVAVALSLPLLIIVCGMLWSVPYTLSESVATFETVSRLPATSFLLPSSSYYRPLFYMTMSALWHGTASLDVPLTGVRFAHIVPVMMLVLLPIWHVRPRTPIAAAAAKSQ